MLSPLTNKSPGNRSVAGAIQHFAANDSKPIWRKNVKIRLGGRGWGSMAEAKRSAQILLDDCANGEILEGFARRLVRDMLDYYTRCSWYLSHGDVVRIAVEDQGKDRVFAIYLGPMEQRFYFGLTNVRWNPKTEQRQVSELARALISDQIKSFRHNTPTPETCAICKLPITANCKLAVDHIETYASLLKAFLVDFPAPDDLGRPDPEWVRVWQEYHAKRATLRIVHARCNLERQYDSRR